MIRESVAEDSISKVRIAVTIDAFPAARGANTCLQVRVELGFVGWIQIRSGRISRQPGLHVSQLQERDRWNLVIAGKQRIDRSLRFTEP